MLESLDSKNDRCISEIFQNSKRKNFTRRLSRFKQQLKETLNRQRDTRYVQSNKLHRIHVYCWMTHSAFPLLNYNWLYGSISDREVARLAGWQGPNRNGNSEQWKRARRDIRRSARVASLPWKDVSVPKFSEEPLFAVKSGAIVSAAGP